ncbi:MAG: segregation and condensation protein A, partial [Acidobacteriaceae bacterium]
MDSAQSRDDAARANKAADEELTGQQRANASSSAEDREVAEPPEQLHLPADPPFAPEQKDKAAEAAARAAERAAEKKAAQEEANTFPFGVTVGQVYDGPLDLLLDLIRKQDIDIYDIPIAKITGQFLAYIENLKQSDIDGAGEFIYMASLLIHIKSKMLLPRSNDGTTDAA